MNTLVQQASTIIGSQEAVTALEQSSSARILVFSDSHGEKDVVVSILEQYGSEVDALVFTGDGFSDLVYCFEVFSQNKKIKAALPPVILAVRGNGDFLSYEADIANGEHVTYNLLNRVTCTIAGKKIFVVHGDHFKVDMGTDSLYVSAHGLDASFVFFGHTHKPYKEMRDGILFLNPGSCSRPRVQLAPSFAIVDIANTDDVFVQYFGIEKTILKNYKIFPLLGNKI